MPSLKSFYASEAEYLYTFHIGKSPAFIYVNNPKCGCSTAKASLNRWYAAWHGQTLEHKSLGDVHSRAFNPLVNPNALGADAEEIILHDPNYFRVTLLREPVSRAVSAYANKLSWDSIERQSFNERIGISPETPLSLTAFLETIHEDSTLRDMNEHWRLQTRQIAASLIKYDMICLTETLDQDLLTVRDRLFPGVASGNFETSAPFLHNRSNASTLVKDISHYERGLIEKIYEADMSFYAQALNGR